MALAVLWYWHLQLHLWWVRLKILHNAQQEVPPESLKKYYFKSNKDSHTLEASCFPLTFYFSQLKNYCQIPYAWQVWVPVAKFCLMWSHFCAGWLHPEWDDEWGSDEETWAMTLCSCLAATNSVQEPKETSPKSILNIGAQKFVLSCLQFIFLYVC